MDNRFEGSLKAHGVPLPPDFKKRMDLLMMGLRRDPKFEDELKEYKKQAGGAAQPVAPPMDTDPNDFLGPKLRCFVKAMGSPYAQTVVRTLFFFLFFVSYLEKVPVVGSVLSAALDVMVAGGKSLVKTIQNTLPSLVGMIPLPYTSFVGMGIAGLFGMIAWPMLAVVSLSRQDFAFAIESFIRVIIPPIGNTLADLFMEANRMVGRIDSKRIKLGQDLNKAFLSISNAVSSVSEQASNQVKKGADFIANATSKVSIPDLSKARSLGTGALDKAKGIGTGALDKAKEQGAAAVDKAKEQGAAAVDKAKEQGAAAVDKVQVAGKLLSRRARKKDKWHRRTQRRSERR
jgi:hypothetical protein